MVSFRTNMPDLNEQFSNYFDIHFVNWGYDYGKDDYIYSKEQDAEKCTYDHFDNTDIVKK